MKPSFCIVLFLCLTFSLGTSNAKEKPSSAIQQARSDERLTHADDAVFQKEIRPLLVKYCGNCHEPGNMEDLEFLTAETHHDVAKLRDVFAGVADSLKSHRMPPRNDDQPSDDERKLVTEWIMNSLDLKSDYFDRIAPYVVEIYEDKNGHLWFGTMEKGVARYDGNSLTWFTKEDGLPCQAVPSISEDKDRNLWVGTQDGVCRFNGKSFERIGVSQGLPAGGQPSAMNSASVTADQNGNIWAGVGRKVYRLDGKTFSEFKVPVNHGAINSWAIVDGSVSLKLVDRRGNLWFGTDGYGAFKYDGTSFTHFTKESGLCSNNVTSIMEDQKGKIWFTCIQSFRPAMTGDGGVCHYDGTKFSSFPDVKGLSKNDIYTIYETQSGNIWIGATGVGAYRFDGKNFTLFNETDRKHWTRHFGLQSMLEDKNGELWFGFSGGLFRFNGKSFENVPSQIDDSSDKSVGDVLNHLQPTIMVVDGDPIQTTIDELMSTHRAPEAGSSVDTISSRVD